MSVTRQNWTSHLARLKKTFHSGKQVSPNRKKFIWENEQDDGRRDDGKRDDGKRDDGMSAPPRKRTCYDQRNSFGSASRGSIRRAERHCVLYATALEKPSQSGFEQHFVQIHPFKVDVHCWVPNVTIGLADSADEQSSWIIIFWFCLVVARRNKGSHDVHQTHRSLRNMRCRAIRHGIHCHDVRPRRCPSGGTELPKLGGR